jgi:hypothetical protein
LRGHFTLSANTVVVVSECVFFNISATVDVEVLVIGEVVVVVFEKVVIPQRRGFLLRRRIIGMR